MKSNQLLKIILAILLMAFSLGFATPWPVSGQSADQPQDETTTTANVGTAFTYQGQLLITAAWQMAATISVSACMMPSVVERKLAAPSTKGM